MDISQIKLNRALINQAVEIAGVVVNVRPTKGGFWLHIKDKTGAIFVFSRYHFKARELLKIKGAVKFHHNSGVYIYGHSVIRAYQPRVEMKKEFKLPKINLKIVAVIFVISILVIAGLFYFNREEAKPRIQTKQPSETQLFIQSVNDNFTAALNSCTETGNSNKKDSCLYRIAPYATKQNLSLAINICKRISDNSKVTKCLNFLSMYMKRKDIDLSIDICNNINDTSSKNNCVLSLVPDLFKQDEDKALELCSQFDNILKDNCNYNIALTQIGSEEGKVYCDNIVNSTVKDNCLNSFNQTMV